MSNSTPLNGSDNTNIDIIVSQYIEEKEITVNFLEHDQTDHVPIIVEIHNEKIKKIQRREKYSILDK